VAALLIRVLGSTKRSRAEGSVREPGRLRHPTLVPHFGPAGPPPRAGGALHATASLHHLAGGEARWRELWPRPSTRAAPGATSASSRSTTRATCPSCRPCPTRARRSREATRA